MKILVLFGSASDEAVYDPFCRKAEEAGHQVHFAVLSAHRNPDELALKLENEDYQVAVGGAGISAHLPGVIASKISKPVFGIPVNAHFGGLDALFSIFQMPFGVPVMSCAPDGESDIVRFLEEIPESFDTIYVTVQENVLNYEYADKELSRARTYAREREVELEIVHSPRPGAANICLVSDFEKTFPEAPGCLQVPLIEKSVLRSPTKALDVYHAIKTGGLWVGVNNTRNAICSWLKFKGI